MNNIGIEISSYCNQKCYFCPQHKYRLKNRVMSMDLFKAIIDSINDIKIPIQIMSFSGMGEPLTDDTIFKKTIYARKTCTSIYNIHFYTNGALFTKEKMILANKTMSQVYFSIHTNTPEEYERYSGNKFENIKNIVTQAKSIIGNKLIILNYPEGKLGKYLDVSTDSIHPFHNWGDKEIEKKTGSKMSGCRFCGMMESTKIRVDGSISTCGNDWNAKNDILNKKFPVCKKCYNYEHFKEMAACSEFENYIKTLRDLQERINEYTGV